MTEWWTYRLSEFLLFSPRTYYRLFELHNVEVWPAQVVALAIGVAILALSHSPTVSRQRAAAALLAGCWLWVAWAFHLQRYATINWAAPWFAAGFALEAVLLIWAGIFGRRFFTRAATRPIDRVGAGIFLFALLVQPLIGPSLGRDWAQAEIFGVAPDPTAVATLGVVLPSATRAHWSLLLVPSLWCAVSGATLWAMDSPDAWVTPAAALLALAVAIRSRWPSDAPRGGA